MEHQFQSKIASRKQDKHGDNTSFMMYHLINEEELMQVPTYKTGGGKDIIREFLDRLDVAESTEGYFILAELKKRGMDFLDSANTRHIENKLREIKFRRHNRIFYVLY